MWELNKTHIGKLSSQWFANNPALAPWSTRVHCSWTLLLLLHLVLLSLELSLEHLSSHCETLDASALWYPTRRKFKGCLETLSTFLMWQGTETRVRSPWCLLPSVVWSQIRGQLTSSCCLSLKIYFKIIITIIKRGKGKFHQPCHHYWSPPWTSLVFARAPVCVLKRLINYSWSHYGDKCESDYWCWR